MLTIEGIDHQQAKEILHAPTPKEILNFYQEPYPLSKNQIQFYRENGFIKLERVLNGKYLDYARKVIGAAVLLRKEHDKRTLAEKSQYEQSFLQCGYLCWDFPAVKDFVFGKRFAGIARDLMGGDQGVRLWHDQALFKEPGGRITDIHIDSSYWPLAEPQNSTTLWLALTDVPQNKGSLFFYPGSHRWQEHEYVDIFKNPHQPLALANKERIATDLKAGDATFHSGLTYHGAGANATDELREAMTIIYIRDGMHFDESDARNATHTSCQGLKNGQIIDTRCTPLLA